LLLATLGLLPWRGGWATGEVALNGKNLLSLKERQARQIRGREIALIPQSPTSALNDALTLRSHFEQAWKAHRPAGELHLLTPRLDQLLRRVHLPLEPDFLRRKPGQISVGQAQRTCIALALLHHPSVLIADEPTSALDPVTASQVLDLLREVTNEEGAALLFVSHDLLSVFQLCSHTAILHEGRVVESLPIQDLPNAQHDYTRALLASFPVPLAAVLDRAAAVTQSATTLPLTEELVTPA
jgi:ABC-type glutathione transport system ATPase component